MSLCKPHPTTNKLPHFNQSTDKLGKLGKGMKVNVCFSHVFDGGCSVAMEEHRATCEAEGRYVEAELAKNRIAELKEQAFSSQMEELLYLHD